MGQYYKPVSLDLKEYLYSHDYDSGLKLMEHSYIGNSFVSAVENLLIPGGRWHKHKIVWAGDYAEALEGEEDNIYNLAETKINPEKAELDEKWRYLCNHTKKLYVDYKKVIPFDNGLTINPLPFLTCDGDGKRYDDGADDRIGSWTRDVISIEENIPEGFKEIDGDFGDL
jgi:hypothetical protein